MVLKRFNLLGDNINLDFSKISLASILIGIVGLFWLQSNDIAFGEVYFNLITISMVALAITFIFIREESRETMKKFVKIPFTTNSRADSVFYIFGWLLVILIFYVPILLLNRAGFTLYQFSLPLTAAQTVSGQAFSFVTTTTQNFATLEALTSTFLTLFIIVFVAGSFEEFVFGFVWPLSAGAFMAFFYERSKFLQKLFSERTFLFTSALILVSAGFMGIHALNESYVLLRMFLYAGAFRLVMNLAIYKAGAPLSFTMGIHHANNFLWYLAIAGGAAVAGALFSGWGLVLIAFIAIIFIHVVSDIGESYSILKSFFSNLWRG